MIHRTLAASCDARLPPAEDDAVLIWEALDEYPGSRGTPPPVAW